MEKSEAAFRTIGEVSADLGVPQHVLRYWETRFPQLKPVTRAGNRRYYRPTDVALARRIHALLGQEGYTVRGVQKLLAVKAPIEAAASVAAPPVDAGTTTPVPSPALIAELRVIRTKLAELLAAS